MAQWVASIHGFNSSMVPVISLSKKLKISLLNTGWFQERFRDLHKQKIACFTIKLK